MFTFRVNQGAGGGYAVYSGGSYRVAVRDDGRRLLVIDGAREITVHDGWSVYVMNESGSTVDRISPAQRREAALRQTSAG